jgi:hypothetical protein
VGLRFQVHPPISTDTNFIHLEIETTTAQRVTYNHIQHLLLVNEYIELVDKAVFTPDDNIIEHIVATIYVEETK